MAGGPTEFIRQNCPNASTSYDGLMSAADKALLDSIVAQFTPIPSQAGQAGKVLGTDGTNLEWVDQTGGGGTSYESIALLRAATPPSDGTVVGLSGHYEQGDGDFGTFYYDSSSTAADNGGLVLRPNSVNSGSPGRWIRLYDFGEINVKWLGAIGDGTSHPLSEFFANLAAAQAIYPFATALTNEVDWAAAQAAANMTQLYYPTPSGAGRNTRGGTVVFPRGLYYHDQPIASGAANEVFYSFRMRGVGPQGFAGSGYQSSTSWIIYTGDADRYLDLRSSYYCTVEDLSIWYNNLDFAGKTLIDCTWNPDALADATNICIRRCSLAGDPGVFGPGQGAKALISLHLAIICQVFECSFGQSQGHIRFREFPPFGQAYSNSHSVKSCTFMYGKWNIVNVGECITVADCALEGLGGYTEASVYDDSQRTEAEPAVTFEVVGGATQTIELIDAAGRTWADFGFVVGMVPFFLDRVNRVNGVNNKDLTAIASFTGGGTIMNFVSSPGLTTQTNTWGALLGASTTAGVPGGYAKATPGLTLTFNAAAKTITRNTGSWLDDNWDVGDSAISFVGFASNDGVKGPITALTDTVMTIASATLVDEVTDEGAIYITTAAGPFTFTGNWCGDQFLPGAIWLKFNQPPALLRVSGNLFVGSTQVLRLNTGGSAIIFEGNTISSVLNPIYVNPTGLGWSNARLEGNNAGVPLLDPDGQAILNNLWMICNGQYAADYIDLLLETFVLRTRLEIVGGEVGNMTGFYDAAFALTQGVGGSLAMGSDATSAMLQTFGASGLRINKDGSPTAIGKSGIGTSRLDVGGAISSPCDAVQTADFTAGETISHYPINATSGNRTATLPAASGCPGREYTFERTDSSGNTCTIAGTLGGNHTLADANSRLRVKSDGTNWRKVSWQ